MYFLLLGFLSPIVLLVFFPFFLPRASAPAVGDAAVGGAARAAAGAGVAAQRQEVTAGFHTHVLALGPGGHGVGTSGAVEQGDSLSPITPHSPTDESHAVAA